VRFQEKWRLALTLLRRARAAGVTHGRARRRGLRRRDRLSRSVHRLISRMPWAFRRI
jgi:hypothetical protein